MTLRDFDLSKIQRIGLDKIQLSNLAIMWDIDFARLRQKDNNVEIQTTADQERRCRRYIPDTHIGITKIIIKDNQIFQDLIVGCASDSNGFPIEYTYLTITVDNAKGCNLENMTYNEYTDYIASVLTYIEHQYGISLLASDMKLDYLEINANILLKQEFPKYSRVYRLLMAQFDNHLGKLRTYSNLKNKDKKGLQEESYTRGNNSKEIVFYDKTQELKDSDTPFEDDMPILRIELRLKTGAKIKSTFETRLWNDLDDKKIVEHFHQEIYSHLSKKFEEWEGTRKKELKKLIVKCRKESTKVWHHLVMQEIRNKSESMMIPYVLDIEQVCNAFKELPDPNRNATRSIKSLLNISIENDIYRNNDTDKVREIFNALKSYAESTV